MKRFAVCVVFAGIASITAAASWEKEVADTKTLIAIAKRAPANIKAPALTVYDHGAFLREKNGHTTEVTQYTTQVLSDEAIRSGIADIEIHYNGYYQKLISVRARTIRTDGTVIEIPKSDFHEGRDSGDDGVYSSEKVVRFSFPGVTKGCILDYYYATETVKEVMPGHFSENWIYWTGAPCLESSLVLEFPSDSGPFFFRNTNHTVEPVITNLGDSRKRMVWRMTKLDAVQSEPSMPPLSSLFPRTEISTNKSWEDVGKWYWGLAMPLAKLDPEISLMVADVTRTAASPTDKAAAILKWMNSNFRYVSVSLDESSHLPHPPAEVYLKRYGDCKDQSLFLVATLRSLGINAWLALLSAGDTDPIHDELPSVYRFDHCIVVADLDGKQVWMDPTDPSTQFGDVPDSVKGVEALVIREHGGEVVSAPSRNLLEPAESQLTVEVKVNPDNSCDVKLEINAYGSAASNIKDAVTGKDHTKIDEVFRSSLKDVYPGVRDITVSYKPSDDTTGPLTVLTQGHVPLAGEMVDQKLVLSALGESGDLERESWTGEDDVRDYPFVFHDNVRQSVVLKVMLPKGWKLDECLKPFTLNGPGREVSRTVELKDDVLTMVYKDKDLDATLPSTALIDIVRFQVDLAAKRKGRIVLERPVAAAGEKKAVGATGS